MVKFLQKICQNRFRTLSVVVTSTVSCAFALTAIAQGSYPASPVRLVLGFPPGATTDLIARLLAPKLASAMNANFVVENREGANGNIGADLVAKARPDGYTILLNTSGVVLSLAIGDKVNYDLFKDLAPVALMATAPQLLVVHPSLPVNNVAEFIAYAKANADKLAYSSSGVGSNSHLAPLLFLQAHGLTALHVPYKGTGPAVVDLAAGRVQFGMQSMTTMLPLAREKRLKALAVTSLKRLALLPELPTLAEMMPGFEIGNWFGIMVPGQTPSAIIKRLNAEIVKAMQDPAIKSRLAQEGTETLASTPEEYGAYMRREMERWGKAMKSSGVVNPD